MSNVKEHKSKKREIVIDLCKDDDDDKLQQQISKLPRWESKSSGTVTIVSWNVNDLLARYLQDGGLKSASHFIVEQTAADICILQEVWFTPKYIQGKPPHGIPSDKIRPASWGERKEADIRTNPTSWPSVDKILTPLFGSKNQRKYHLFYSLQASARGSGTIVAVRKGFEQPNYVTYNLQSAEEMLHNAASASATTIPKTNKGKRYSKKFCTDHHYEGRIILLGYKNVDILATYVPWLGKVTSRRIEWDEQLEKFFSHRRCQGQRPIIWIGDLNVAPTAADVSHPSEMTSFSGFTLAERERFQTIVRAGDLIDAWRYKHPTPWQNGSSSLILDNTMGPHNNMLTASYSWRNAPGSHPEAIAMRLDHAFLTRSLLPYIIRCDLASSGETLDGFYGSDHCPLVLTLVRFHFNTLILVASLFLFFYDVFHL
jgi:exonuclease III